MSAPLLSLLAALSFALSNVALYRGTRTASTRAAVLLSVFLGVPFFLVAAGATGELREVPLTAAALFAAGGVIHFVVGRSFLWAAIGMIGASRAVVFTSLSPVFALALAVVLLDESINALTLVGAALVISGPVVASRPAVTADAGVRAVAPRWTRGMTLALLGAICWGFSPIVIKAALDRTDAVIMGTLISYAGAACVLAVRAAASDKLEPFRSLDRNSLKWFVVAALGTNIAQFLNYAALSRGDVAIVVVLLQITPILVAGLTYLVSREIERVTTGVVVGGLLAVVGSILVVSST